jgi:hypothetical protein
LKYITYFILASFSLLACTPIPATNPWDPNTSSAIQQPATVMGQVILAGGGDLAVIAPNIQVDLNQLNELESQEVRSTVDSEGYFSLTKVIPGNYLLSITAPGYTVYNTSLSIRPGDELTVGVVMITALPASSVNSGVNGSVLLGAQTDHSGVLIQVIGQPYSVVSNEEGLFTIPLAEGVHTLSFSYNGYQSQQQEVIINENEFTALTEPILLLGQPGQIAGTLMLPQGYDLSALSDAYISLHRVSDEEVDTQEFARTIPSTQDGSFLLSGVEVGSYQLTVYVSGFNTLIIPTLTVEPAIQLFVGLLVLSNEASELGVIRGLAKLSHPVGTGHAGILVEVLDTPYRTQTASDGSYTITLPLNRYDLQFSYNGFGSEQLNSVPAVTLGELNEDLSEVVLSGIEASVELSVYGVHTEFEDSEILQDATVLLNLSEGGVLTASFDDETQSYKVGQVSAGTHTLLVSHPRFSNIEKTIVVNWGDTYLLNENIELADENPPQITEVFTVDSEGIPNQLSNESLIHIHVAIEVEPMPLQVHIELAQEDMIWTFPFEAQESSKVFSIDVSEYLIANRVLDAQIKVSLIDGSYNIDEERLTFTVDQEAPLPLIFQINDRDSEQDNYIISEQVVINTQPNFNGEWRVSIHEDPRVNLANYSQPILRPMTWNNFGDEDYAQLILEAEQETGNWISTSDLSTNLNLPLIEEEEGRGFVILVHARDEAGNISYSKQAMWIDQKAPLLNATLIHPVTEELVEGTQSISMNIPRVHIQLESNEISECVTNRFQNSRCTFTIEVDTSSDFLNATHYLNFEDSVFEIIYLLANRDDIFEIYIRVTDAAGNTTITTWSDGANNASIFIDQTPPMTPNLSVLNHASHKTRFLITRNDSTVNQEDDLSHFEVERLVNRDNEVNGWKSFPLYPIVADDEHQAFVSEQCKPKDCRSEWSCLWFNPNLTQDEGSSFSARGVTLFEDRHQQSYDISSYRIRAIDRLGNESPWSTALVLEEALAPPLVQSLSHYEEAVVYKTFYWNRKKNLSNRSDSYILFNPLYDNTRVESTQISELASYTIQPGFEAYRPVDVDQENLATEDWITYNYAMYSLSFEDVITSLSSGWITKISGFLSHHIALHTKRSQISSFDIISSPINDRYMLFYDQDFSDIDNTFQYVLSLQKITPPYHRHRWSTILPINYVSSINLIAPLSWNEGDQKQNYETPPAFAITSSSFSSNQIYLTALSGVYAGFSSRIQAPEFQLFELHNNPNQSPKIHGWIKEESLQFAWINQENTTRSLMRASIDDLSIIGQSRTIRTAEVIQIQNWRSLDQNVLSTKLVHSFSNQSNLPNSLFYLKSNNQNGLQHNTSLMWLNLEDDLAQPVIVQSGITVNANLNAILDVIIDQDRWHVVLGRLAGDEIEINNTLISPNKNFISHLSWNGEDPAVESLVYVSDSLVTLNKIKITLVPPHRLVVSFYDYAHQITWADMNDHGSSLNFIDVPITTFGNTFKDTKLSVNSVGTPQIHTITDEGVIEEISLEALNLKQQAQNLEIVDIIESEVLDSSPLTRTQAAKLLPINTHATRGSDNIDHVIYLKRSSLTEYDLHYQAINTMPTQTPQDPLNDEASSTLDSDVINSIDIASNQNGDTWISWLSHQGAIPGHTAVKLKYIGRGDTPILTGGNEEIIIDQVAFDPINYIYRDYGLISRLSIAVDDRGTVHLTWLSDGEVNATHHNLSYVPVSLEQWNLRDQIELNPIVHPILNADRLNFDNVVVQLFAGQPVVALNSFSTIQIWGHIESLNPATTINDFSIESYDQVTWVDHALFLVSSGFNINAKKIQFLCETESSDSIYRWNSSLYAMASESETKGCYPNVNQIKTNDYEITNRPYNRLNQNTDLLYQIIQFPNQSFGFFYTEYNQNDEIDLKYKPLFDDTNASSAVLPVYSPILQKEDLNAADQSMSHFAITSHHNGNHILYMLRSRDLITPDLGPGLYRQHLSLGAHDESVNHTPVGVLYNTPGVSPFNWDGDAFNNIDDPCPTVYGNSIE